jgi:phosphoribosylglycinamide formyltransferase-1
LFKIVILVSGSGSNLQAIIDAIKNKYLLDTKITYVLSSVGDAYALTRAKLAEIPTHVVRKQPDISSSQKIIDFLKDKEVDLIVCAGFLEILSKELVDLYKHKIINIHPSLLPKYGGKGMYGIKVHEAVIANKERDSGCTVHYVDSGIDTGQIILQQRVKVKITDTPSILQARILQQEHLLLPRAIRLIKDKKIQ